MGAPIQKGPMNLSNLYQSGKVADPKNKYDDKYFSNYKLLYKDSVGRPKEMNVGKSKDLKGSIARIFSKGGDSVQMHFTAYNDKGSAAMNYEMNIVNDLSSSALRMAGKGGYKRILQDEVKGLRKESRKASLDAKYRIYIKFLTKSDNAPNVTRTMRFSSDRGGLNDINSLYKNTQLQDTFGTIMLSLVDGVPKVLNLLEMIMIISQLEL